MKIEGIDPVALSRVQEEAVKQEVKETERPDADTRVRHRGPDPGEKPSAPKEIGMPAGISEAIEKLNDTVQSFNKDLRFQLHEESSRWMVRVLDIAEDEIIKEIPTEEVLNVVAQIQTLIGVLLDDRR